MNETNIIKVEQSWNNRIKFGVKQLNKRLIEKDRIKIEQMKKSHIKKNLFIDKVD